MKIATLLTEASKELKAVNRKRSTLEARLLLSHILQCRPEEVIQRDQENLSFQQEQSARQLVDRRLRYEPMAYILGRKEFFGLEYEVSRDVLIPRPETEALIEEVLRWTSSRNFTKGSVIDLGTGSGCLAITLARHLPPDFEIFAMDISSGALKMAKRNAEKNSVREIHWLKSDLRSEPFGSWTLVISNPPYIPTSELEDLQPDIRYYEPRQALDGGLEGLDYLEAIFQKWTDSLVDGGMLALETQGPKQVEALKELAAPKKGRFWSLGPHFFWMK